MLFFSKARSTPMCAMPLAKPPPSAKPIRGSLDLPASPVPNNFANQPGADLVSTAPILLPPQGRVECLIYVPLHLRCISASRVVRILALVSVICITFTCLTPARAQRELSGAAEAKLALDQLNVVGSVLMIAAHPDDENTALLAYLARGRKVRTGYLSLTRGEGGQNLIGSEQGDALGVIRTQELLAARRIDGAEQFFTRAIDFGFTKTAQETFEKWGHDKILSDVVWVIRRFRPDVIILRFTGTARDGHGQHQVSAILGKEAFAAAGDAVRFPDQLRYVQPWRAKRIVRAEFNFGGGRGGIGPPPGAQPTPPQPTFPPLPPAGAV